VVFLVVFLLVPARLLTGEGVTRLPVFVGLLQHPAGRLAVVECVGGSLSPILSTAMTSRLTCIEQQLVQTDVRTVMSS
jgi:hypothetical protein